MKSDTAKANIKQVLEQLVGLELTDIRRLKMIVRFGFGTLWAVNRKGKEFNKGLFGIHLQCPWRVTKGKELLFGECDIYKQADEIGEYDEDFDWTGTDESLCDIKSAAFLKSGVYTVESVKTDDFSGFELCFNDSVKLTVFPCISEKTGEHWRLTDSKKDVPDRYFIVSPVKEEIQIEQEDEN